MRIHRHAANPEGDFPGEGLGGDGADLLGIVEIAGEGESSVLDRPGGTTDHGQLAREPRELSQLAGEVIVGDEENVRPLRPEPAVKGEGLELLAAMGEDGFHGAVDAVPGERSRGMIAAALVMFPVHHEPRPAVTGLLQPLDEAEHVLEMVDDDLIELRARDGEGRGNDGEFPPVEQVVEGSQIRHRQEQQSLHPAGVQHPHQAITRHLFRFDVDHVMRKARGPRTLDRSGEQQIAECFAGGRRPGGEEANARAEFVLMPDPQVVHQLHDLGIGGVSQLAGQGLDPGPRFQADARLVAQRERDGLPDTYRITGPDTYEKRKEDNLLLNMDLTPFKNLALSGGAYYTKQETEELALNVLNMTNGSGGVDLRNSLTSIADNEYTGPGSPWPDQISTRVPVWSTANPFFIARDSLKTTEVNPLDNTKITRYWWSKRPTSSESVQWRLRGTYSLDLELPVVGASNHTFLAGNHFINDKVRFLNGEETIVRAYNRSADVNDALYFRSVNDYTPFRYNGENLAMPGTRYSEQSIWFKGFYGVYQGRFWNDRIGTLFGVRYDEYNAATKDFIRLDPARSAGLTREQIQAQELGYVNNPTNQTYGSFDPTDNFSKPISNWSKTMALNYKLNSIFTAYALYSEGIAPNTGLADGNNQFIKAEETTSRELGVKFGTKNNKITGSLSVYKIQRKNAIWDFAYAPAPARWKDSPNLPVGQSQTSNRFDPKPAIGQQVLTYGINAKETPAAFQNAYIAGNSSTTDPVTLHKTYYITTRDPAGNALRQQIPGLIDFANPGGTADSPQIFYVKHADMDVPFNFSYTNSTGSLATEKYTWRQFFEKAFANKAVSADVAGQYDPLDYTRQESFFGEFKGGNNPSLESSDGANVTFTDEAKGIDLELILQPNENFQVLLNYSYTQRAAIGAFKMSDFISLADGKVYAGTEYDQIVRVFGREAFGIKSEDTNGDGVMDKFTDRRGQQLSATNPLLPSEAVSGIDGVSLFFNPAHQASVWSRYEFTEGPMKNFSVGAGANYTSAAQTSVAIGGNEVGQNLFPTPDTSPNWSFDAGLYYRFRLGRTRWNVRLNIRNLLDDRVDTTTVGYHDDFNNRDVNKRSEVFRTPRTFRLSTSMAF